MYSVASFPDLPRFYLPFAFTITSLQLPCIIVNANESGELGLGTRLHIVVVCSIGSYSPDTDLWYQRSSLVN